MIEQPGMNVKIQNPWIIKKKPKPHESRRIIESGGDQEGDGREQLQNTQHISSFIPVNNS